MDPSYPIAIWGVLVRGLCTFPLGEATPGANQKPMLGSVLRQDLLLLQGFGPLSHGKSFSFSN